MCLAGPPRQPQGFREEGSATDREHGTARGTEREGTAAEKARNLL